jgi:hypothetical protein
MALGGQIILLKAAPQGGQSEVLATIAANPRNPLSVLFD